MMKTREALWKFTKKYLLQSTKLENSRKISRKYKIYDYNEYFQINNIYSQYNTHAYYVWL